ncbi:hypothetical protein D3C73_944790 [compost metagenome]
MIRDSIDKGLPCYAWEMDKPLYYMIAGYDEIGYYYIDPDTEKTSGPKPYMELGDTDWGCLEIHIIPQAAFPIISKRLKVYLNTLLMSEIPMFINLTKVLRWGRKVIGFGGRRLAQGMSTITGWLITRPFGPDAKVSRCYFYRKESSCIGIMGDLFDRAISKYEDTAKSLSRLSQLFPLQTEATLEIDEHHQDEGMLLLKTAQDSETRGLSEIKRILDEIYKIW